MYLQERKRKQIVLMIEVNTNVVDALDKIDIFTVKYIFLPYKIDIRIDNKLDIFISYLISFV